MFQIIVSCFSRPCWRPDGELCTASTRDSTEGQSWTLISRGST